MHLSGKMVYIAEEAFKGSNLVDFVIESDECYLSEKAFENNCLKKCEIKGLKAIYSNTFEGNPNLVFNLDEDVKIEEGGQL